MQTLSIASEPQTNIYTSNRDLYREVTNRVIALIEKGVAPWRRTWNVYGLARNYVTGHVYTGINMILLNNTEHPIPYFMTFKQVKEQGGKIRKGAKGHKVIYFRVYYKDDNDQTLSQEDARGRLDSGEDIQVLKFIKNFTVFNIEDVEGIKFNISEIELKPNERIEKCEKIVANMPSPPELRHIDGIRAFYSPKDDFVNMPAIEQFDSAEDYYATYFHELIHSTGHTSRLNREELMKPEGFASKAYSQEEIIAEMGASFLCSTVQIDFDNIIENNAAYLAGWLDVLKEDSKFIFRVAAEAQKAADYILNRQQLNSN